MPIVSTGAEGQLQPELLTLKHLRQRLEQVPTLLPEGRIEQLAGKFERPPIVASVLLAILDRPEGMTLLLTQRTDHLNNHSGQVSLPGGQADIDDVTPMETALREAEEEISLNRDRVEILGCLPDYYTVTNYRITPVVSLVFPPVDLLPDPFEVAEIYEVPLAFIMNGNNHQVRVAEYPDGSGRRTFYTIPYGRCFIWGATAGILRNLFHLLRA